MRRSSSSTTAAATASTTLAAMNEATSAYVRGDMSGAIAAETPSHFAGPAKIVAARKTSAAPKPPNARTARRAFSTSPRFFKTAAATTAATRNTMPTTMTADDGQPAVWRTGMCLLMTSDCINWSARWRQPICIIWYVSATGIK